MNAAETLEKGRVRFLETYVSKHVTGALHKDVLCNIFTKHWSMLASLPASKTGKYHHKMEIITPFGMINHLMRTNYFVMELVNEEGLNSRMDDFVVAALLHDIGMVKVRGYEDYKVHGIIGADMIAEDISKLSHFADILIMIRNHMHHWQDNRMIGVDDRIIAYADYMASRPEIDINGFVYITSDMFDCENDDEDPTESPFAKW